MLEKLVEAFETINIGHGWEKPEEGVTPPPLPLPYSRQGSYEEEETLPEVFFTYWNVRTPESWFYDNKAHRAEWEWNVFCYATDIDVVYTKLSQLITIMREKGFTVDGRGTDVPSGEPSYYGRMIKAVYEEHYGGAENE